MEEPIGNCGTSNEGIAHSAEDIPPIKVAYLLVTGIPCYVDEAGNRWTDALWHKDLLQHVRYIKNLTVAAPLRYVSLPAGAKCLSNDARLKNVRFVDLPASDSHLAGVWNWPCVLVRLWHAVGRAQFVHAGVADWPIPTGWAATIAAKLRARPLLINVESAFWRVERTASPAKRARSWIWETFNRWCVRQAALPLFTHHEYARQMLRNPEQGHVFQASWIDAENIIDEQAAELSWDAKEENRDLRVLFAGRLVVEKGVSDLLEAMAGTQLRVRLDIMGEGGLAGAVSATANLGRRVRLLPSLPYDASFFELLRRYDAVIVPGRTDEQPRIIYDAYSQAVPVLATHTAGNSECVIDGETGYLTQLKGAPAVRELIEKALADRSALRRMGIRGLHLARSYTHQEMHHLRWHLLTQLVGKLTDLRPTDLVER